MLKIDGTIDPFALLESPVRIISVTATAFLGVLTWDCDFDCDRSDACLTEVRVSSLWFPVVVTFDILYLLRSRSMSGYCDQAMLWTIWSRCLWVRSICRLLLGANRELQLRIPSHLCKVETFPTLWWPMSWHFRKIDLFSHMCHVCAQVCNLGHSRFKLPVEFWAAELAWSIGSAYLACQRAWVISVEALPVGLSTIHDRLRVKLLQVIREFVGLWAGLSGLGLSSGIVTMVYFEFIVGIALRSLRPFEKVRMFRKLLNPIWLFQQPCLILT